MGNELNEYSKRLVPASEKEIIELAKIIWADKKLRRIFERVGYHGDLTEAEETSVAAAIDEFRQGALWDRDELHLMLSPCLARQVAAGMLDGFDSPEAKRFIDDRRVVRMDAVVRGVKPTVQEVLTFAKAVRNDPGAWAIILSLKDDPDMLLAEGDPDGVLALFEAKYRRKYGLFNRFRFGSAIGLLRGVAAGAFSDIDSPDAENSIRRSLERMEG